MTLFRIIPLLLTFLFLSGPANSAHSLDPKSERAIRAFLSSQESPRESTESQGVASADLDKDGKPELVVVWTLLGPTHWHNNLTVLSQTPKGYRPAASLQLEGEARLSSVESGIILVDQAVYAKDDPICCPSIKKQLKYLWLGKRIEQLRE